MSTPVSTKVTPALHPDNVTQVDGYDEETAPVLAPTLTAFDEAYQGIQQVHAAREKAKSNPTWNEAMQIIHTQQLADKVLARVAKAMDGTRAALEKGIAHLEKELSQPVESRASHPIAQEIRAHIKSLPAGQRMPFIKEAIEADDHDTAQAALGTVSYLSGIDAKTQAILTRIYHEKASPLLAKRLKAMSGAKALIEERGGLVFGELEKAVGVSSHKVKQLRDAKDAAEQAFVLKGVA
jgi:hypothetical protein